MSSARFTRRQHCSTKVARHQSSLPKTVDSKDVRIILASVLTSLAPKFLAVIQSVSYRISILYKFQYAFFFPWNEFHPTPLDILACTCMGHFNF